MDSNERSQFEKWAQRNAYTNFSRSAIHRDLYDDVETDSAWEGWHARSALALGQMGSEKEIVICDECHWSHLVGDSHDCGARIAIGKVVKRLAALEAPAAPKPFPWSCQLCGPTMNPCEHWTKGEIARVTKPETPDGDPISDLRTIRDAAWQCTRQHEAFAEIEKLAVGALKKLGIDDGPGPNPRTNGWWIKPDGDLPRHGACLPWITHEDRKSRCCQAAVMCGDDDICTKCGNPCGWTETPDGDPGKVSDRTPPEKERFMRGGKGYWVKPVSVAAPSETGKTPFEEFLCEECDSRCCITAGGMKLTCHHCHIAKTERKEGFHAALAAVEGPVAAILRKCEQYWNEPNICDAEVDAALEAIHREASTLRRLRGEEGGDSQ